MTFLDHIVLEIQKQHGEDLADLCIVVPTRRAVVFLREALARQYPRTMWAPRMISIQDLVRELSGWQFPEPLTLIFELYEVYIQVMRRHEQTWEEPFEQFYAWGEMLVKDFDEVDKYLVDAEKLFANISDLKEIEAMFALSDENLEELERFWKAVRGEGADDPTELQARFLKIWATLYEVYEGYRASLAARRLAYDGMAYRYLVGRLAADDLALPYRQVIFAGFNALSRAEEALMKGLLERERAVVYWDVDRSYFATVPGESSRVGEEPGKFIREYHDKWRKMASHLIVHDMLATPKDLWLTGVPRLVGQAQHLGNLLQRAYIEPDALRRHAVVLADENLLFPTLYSLPESIDSLNITMGYPLRQTHVFHLVITLTRMMRSRRDNLQGEQAYAHQEVLDVLNNPYIKAREPQWSESLQDHIRIKNLIFIPQSLLTAPELPALIRGLFDTPPAAAGMEAYFDRLFHLLLTDARERGARLEAEYIFQMYTQFNHFRAVLKRYPVALSIQGFSRLLREVMQRLRIPFEGEPLEGLQVMGFLETRVLDFERIYILGANEGNLPDTSSGHSFIPYTLRKGFGLPTYEEKDAIYAYHFYRLLQRASGVHLIYNSMVQDSGGAAGEESRFIRQIRHYFRDAANLKIHRQIVSTRAPYFEQPAIQVAANDDTRRTLIKKYTPGEGEASSGAYYSATALTTYITCPLRFYYRYVAGIKEPEAVEANMEANTFGSVLHNTMELLYGDLMGKNIDAEAQKHLRAALPGALKEALRREDLDTGDTLLGKNYLLRDVIRRLCERILKQDALSEAFEVIHLEEETEFACTLPLENGAVRLNGKFDRVDLLRESGIVRILDYKTGQVKFAEKKFTLEDCFVNPDLKEAFQGYFYAYLYRRKYPQAQTRVGYYTARHLSDGILYLDQGRVIDAAVLAEFEDRLKDLITRILHNDYVQTEDEKRCTYCPYNAICNRV